MLLVDAGPLVALADRGDPRRPAVRTLLRESIRPLVVPAPVTAEVDYLLGKRFGHIARVAFVDDLANARFQVEGLTREEHGKVAMLERRYDDLNLGLADLSLVVLAERFGVRDLVTFDERHFRAVRPLQGGVFRLLPVDA
jgi:predicted nucleic acid-binding protein